MEKTWKLSRELSRELSRGFSRECSLLRLFENVESSLNKTQIKVVNAVLDFFGKYKAGELISWSHHPFFNVTYLLTERK